MGQTDSEQKGRKVEITAEEMRQLEPDTYQLINIRYKDRSGLHSFLDTYGEEPAP